jgi:chaperonin GroEL
MIKEIKFNSEATESVLKGINIVADAVKSTYGPGGRNVMIEGNDDIPHITKDGVTVANSIELKDGFESIGAKLIQGVASKTLKDVGDGTTTSAILTQALINEGLKEIQFGTNPFQLKKGMDIATYAIVQMLKEKALILDDEGIKNVARVSANGDEEISDLLYDVFSKISKESTITVNDSSTLDTYFEIIEGISLPTGFENPLFDKNKEDKIIYENPTVFISKNAITDIQLIVPTIKKAQATQTPLVIIAPEIDKGILNTLLINNYNGSLNVLFVRMPGMTEIQQENLNDLGIVIGKPFGMTDYVVGKVSKAIIEQYKASLIPLEEYIPDIESLKETLKSKLNVADKSFKALKDKERIAKLSGKVANIYISANSEVELKEKKDRLDDAIHAVKAALEEGIVLGAGITLKKISNRICEDLSQECPYEGVRAGIQVINTVCNIPFTLLNRVVENKDNIIDPVKVVYTTLQNANSVAGLFLTTNCVIVNSRE